MEDGDHDLIVRFQQRLADDGWQGVVDLAHLLRDQREGVIVSRVEQYLEHLIQSSGEENPTLTVRDVRAHLFEIPQ